MKTRHELKKWREWRAAELERGLAYCHPRWPQEAQYLRAEIKAVRNLSLISGSDWWIYFDWAALVFILATIASHVTFFHYSTDTSKEVHHYIIIPLLLILWFRIFKYARPFEGAGPFVVIFGHVMADIVKWGFLNSVIVIPFTCAFWITFGAISLKPVPGYDNVGPLVYNMFSMMVVNDHGYEDLEKANPVMARLLCGAFIGIAAIVTLNLLIALLSNTFERLYENAVANAVMQRARTILLLQKSLRKKQKKKYYDFIKTNGSPEVIVKTLGRLLMMDGDDRATIERVRDDVKVVVNILGEKFGRKFGKGKKSDLDFVKMDVSKVRRFQEELILEVKNMKQALQEITEKVQEIKINSNNNNNSDNNTEDDNNNNNIDNNNNNNNNKDNTVATLLPVESSTNISLQKGKKLLKQKLRKISEKSSEEESETETSETDSESTTKNNRDGKWIKFKRKDSGHNNRRKSSVLTDLSDKRKKHTKDTIKGDYKRSHLDPKNNDQHTTNQQLAYPPTAGSRIPDMQNTGFPFGEHGYPSNHYSRIQTNYVPLQNQRMSSQTNQAIVAYNQVPQGNNQWFSTTPNRSDYQQRLSVENPHLQQRQDFGQRSDNRQIPTNLDQRSPPHDMRQPSKSYFNKNSSSTSAHPPPVGNMPSLQSSPYVRQPLVKNRFQQPLAMQNAEESYGYQNNGFRPIDQNVNQVMPREYDNSQLVQNIPVLIQNKDGQTNRIIRPITSSVSREPIRAQSTPFTTQVITPYHQNNRNETQHLPHAMMSSPKIYSEFQARGIPQHMKKQSVDTAILHPPKESTRQVENKTSRANAISTNNDKLVPRVDVQLVVDKHQGSRLPDLDGQNDAEVFMEKQLPTEVKVTHEEERATDSVDSSFLPEMAVKETTTVYPERKIPEEVGTNEESEYQASAVNTTQLLPGKIDASQSKESINNSEQNEIQMSRGGTPISIVPVRSQSPGVEISNDENVSENKARFPDPPEGSTAESEFATNDFADDLQDIVKYQTDEGTSSEKTFVHSQGTAEDQIQYSSEELQPADDNEIQEEISPGGTENTDGLLSEEITVVGMKTDPVPDIGWV